MESLKNQCDVNQISETAQESPNAVPMDDADSGELDADNIMRALYQEEVAVDDRIALVVSPHGSASNRSQQSTSQIQVSLITRYHESFEELQRQATRIIYILMVFLFFSAVANGYINFVWNISGANWAHTKNASEVIDDMFQYSFAFGLTTPIS